MKISRIIILCLCLLIVASGSYCEELTQQKINAIKELMSITGSTQLAEIVGKAVFQRMANFVQETNPEIDPRALQIIEEELTSLMREETGEKGSFQQVVYPIYNKYLTLDEIREIIRFYKTPSGKKMISVLPNMMQESMQAIQPWANSLMPRLQQRVFARFEKEGIKTDRGNAYEEKGPFDKAISNYTKALEFNPRDADAYFHRGNAYDNKGQYDEAISDFTKALEINPRDAKAYYNRGATYGKKRQYDEAISDFTKALEINPKDASAYNERGIVYGDKGQYDQAISDYNKALEIDPRDAVVYNNLAWLFATAKETRFRNGEKALQLALKACELTDWKNPSLLDTLAAAYARVGDFQNAVKWQSKALESPEIAKNKEAQERLNFYLQREAWPSD
jgi:tetratricopeptide (TPR) repeat protein